MKMKANLLRVGDLLATAGIVLALLIGVIVLGCVLASLVDWLV